MDQRALQQHALLSFGRRTNAQPPLPVLLQDAVALVGEILDAQFGGVGEVQGETLVLTVTARDDGGRPADPQEHRCSVSDADSMAAFALKSGSVTVSTDLRKENRFRDGFLRSRGVVGALAVPLHVNARPFGVLSVYTDAPRQFSLDDVTFAETIAHLLSASVARIKAEQKLEEVHEIKSSLLGMVDSMVMTLDMEGRVVDMNRACEELTKYSLDDVRDRPFWQSMVAADDADLVKLIFQSSRGSQIPSEFEGEVRARDGSRRRVSWSLKVLSTGQVQTILVTGRDQTAQAEIKAELERMKAVAEETTATLTQLTAKLDKRRTATAPPPAAQELDEEFDGLLPSLEPAPAAGTSADQRRSPRRAYRYRQGIAAMNDKQLPRPGGFFEVEFWDISACGFSFFMDQLPNFDTLVAALGRPPALSHFSARVMRVARMKQGESTRYLIGCDFISRIHLPKTRA
jgi:PAS domain S-box-containing protein